MPGRHTATKQLAQRSALEAQITDRKYDETIHRTTVTRQASQYGMAQTVRLRSCLQMIETTVPDAAPAAAAMVRLAEGTILATLLEFDAEL